LIQKKETDLGLDPDLNPEPEIWLWPPLLCAHNAGIAVEKDRKGFGPSSKHSQPGTVSLEMWFLQCRAGSGNVGYVL